MVSKQELDYDQDFSQQQYNSTVFKNTKLT